MPYCGITLNQDSLQYSSANRKFFGLSTPSIHSCYLKLAFLADRLGISVMLTWQAHPLSAQNDLLIAEESAFGNNRTAPSATYRQSIVQLLKRRDHLFGLQSTLFGLLLELAAERQSIPPASTWTIFHLG